MSDIQIHDETLRQCPTCKVALELSYGRHSQTYWWNHPVSASALQQCPMRRMRPIHFDEREKAIQAEQLYTEASVAPRTLGLPSAESTDQQLPLIS